MEILDENKQIKTETSEVLHKWKLEYEHMFSDRKDEVFDQEHLKKNIVSSIQNPDSNIFPKLDCTSLNSPVTVEEVKHSVYNAKLRKTTGCDNIPADVLRNEYCTDLLFKIIKWAASWQNQQNAQRRLRSAWASAQESSLSAWRKLGSLTTH